MSVRTRKYVALVVVVLLAVALTRVSDAAGWSKGETYAVGAGMLVVFLLVALPWIDMAPDGALRRRTSR
jgi:protein-S-isoprenylcysteine O-methyltransferase Ste14